MDETIKTVGILAAVGIGAYLIWSRLSTGTSKACDTLVGLPRVLCEIGWQVTGGTTILDQDKICASLGGVWNEATGLCVMGTKPCPEGTLWTAGLAGTGYCRPYDIDPPGDCTLPKKWDAILKRCMSPSPGKKTCPDGSIVSDYITCIPSTVKPCPTNNGAGGDFKSCEDGSQVCDIWTCPENNRTIIPSNIVRCPSGALVTLVPGLSLTQACEGSGSKVITNPHYGDCMRGVEHTFQYTDHGAAYQAAKTACETDTSVTGGTRAQQNTFIAACQGIGNLVMGWSGSMVTPSGTFNDPYAWADRFGHQITGQFVKGYIGNPELYPGSGTLYCYKQNPSW